MQNTKSRITTANRVPAIIRGYRGEQVIAWNVTPNQECQSRYAMALDGERVHVTVIADKHGKTLACIHRAAPPPWDAPLPALAHALAQALLDVGAKVRLGTFEYGVNHD